MTIGHRITASLPAGSRLRANGFYDKVRARGQMSDSEKRLRRKIVKLKELRAKGAEELDQLRANVKGLVRELSQMSLENHQLRTERTAPQGQIQVLPTHSQRPTPRGRSTSMRGGA